MPYFTKAVMVKKKKKTRDRVFYSKLFWETFRYAKMRVTERVKNEKRREKKETEKDT
jgi:hypothetical protein